MAESPSAPDALDPRTLSRLAGGLAHELKNPLSTIGLHLDLLREQWVTEESAKARRTVRTLDTLKQEVSRLGDILEDFLAFARTDRMDFALQELNPLVERVVSFLKVETEARGIRLQSLLDYGQPRLRLDGERMRQALLNLILNARQAIGDAGGQITVITRRRGDRVLLEVVDDGPGMDADTLAHCFEVYFSRRKGGSGLGLPTVRRIVEAHGGEFQLESSPGHGTRARILLPIPEVHPAREEDPR